MTSNKRRPAARPGVAAVEFAVLSPLLLFLLVGLWEVGRMVEVQQLLTNAAREGGRQASTANKSADSVKSDVVNYLQRNGISAVKVSDVSITNLTVASRADPTAAEQMDQFRITVSISFSSVRWAILPQITSATTLKGSADWYSMKDIPVTVDSTIPLK